MNSATLPEIIGVHGVFTDGDWVESKDQDPDGEVRLIQLADIGVGEFLDKSNRRLTSAKAEELRCTLLKPGDILVARMPDPIGRACIFPGLPYPSATVVDVCVVRIDREVADRSYIACMLNSPQFLREVLRHAKGSTRSRISRKNLSQLPFPLPPLKEQKRIAGILDQAAELCRLRTRALDKLGTLGQAIFHEMFSSDAAPVIAKKTQLIKDFCEVSSGSTPSRANPAFYNGDILWVKTGEVNGSVIADTEEKVSEEAIIAARLKIYPPETVLVAMYGQGKTRGQVGILGRPAATNQACAALLAGDRIHPKFLFHQLLVSYDRLRDQGRGGNQPNLNAGMIKDFPIYVPDFLRQQEFVDKMQILEQQIAQAYLNKDYLFSLFTSLQHRAFRGEL